MYTLVFLDTETTGNLPDDVLCQLAFKTNLPAQASGETYCELFKPAKKIPPEASAITHITNKMVADKPAFQDSKDYSRIKKLLEEKNTVMVCHNTEFDAGMLKKEGIIPANTICTLRVARALDTKGVHPQYRLQYLRYALEIEIEAQAHNALGDVLVLEALFSRLLDAVKREHGVNDQEAIEKMIEISSKPSILRTFNFGKYNGKSIAEVAAFDLGYLDWLLAQKLQNEANEIDWVYTLKHYLKK
jgi:DNA polymerase III epsilon subunit-like protein